MIKWTIEKIINFPATKRYLGNYIHLGFNDYYGNQYTVDYDNHWVGLVKDNELLWTAGREQTNSNCIHYDINLTKPKYVSGSKDNSIIIAGDRYIHRICPTKNLTEVVIDKNDFAIKDIGNCVYDDNDNIWINEITGCKIWQFSYDGKLMNVLGSGRSGFNNVDVSYNEAQFNWIYDMRKGVDGNIYVLDSKNYAVRMIDLRKKAVRLIAGTGHSGYTGDGDFALSATFGGNNKATFDGPWSLSLDEENNIYIGDTQNCVVRMINSKTKKISTIAGDTTIKIREPNNPSEKNLFNLNLKLICSLNYHDNKLYIPEWDGDLVVLKKEGTVGKCRV